MKIDQDLKKFEKLIRKNTFHGMFNVIIFFLVFYLLNEFLIGVAKGMEINELWKWVFILPFGVWFCGWIQDK